MEPRALQTPDKPWTPELRLRPLGGFHICPASCLTYSHTESIPAFPEDTGQLAQRFQKPMLEGRTTQRCQCSGQKEHRREEEGLLNAGRWPVPNPVATEASKVQEGHVGCETPSSSRAQSGPSARTGWGRSCVLAWLTHSIRSVFSLGALGLPGSSHATLPATPVSSATCASVSLPVKQTD